MKLQAKVQLSLRKSYNIITLEYHTYEKATFDQYLAASIALRAETDNQIESYINDLTGKGSLNIHFKKLVKKVLTFDRTTIEKILTNSMFPVTKIDKSNRYIYYPHFNISVINKNKYYKGNLKDYTKEEIKNIVMLNEELIDFTVSEKDESNKKDTYTVLFDDNNLKINLINNEWFNFEYEHFRESYVNINIIPNLYKGIIKNTTKGDNWSILTETSFNSFVQSDRSFIDDEGDCCIITNDYIKKVCLAYIPNINLYFYKEERIDFNRKNIKYCDLALKYLLSSPILNEIKTKTLINILNNATDFVAQEVINYILSRKDSKEIAQIGLNLIKSGLEKNWQIASLNGMKKFANQEYLNLLYKINHQLDFKISELLSINIDILINEHKIEVEKYKQDRENLIEEINKIIGKITTSGLREKAKQILPQSSDLLKQFTKYCNKYIGHANKSLEELSFDDLKNRLIDVKEFYEIYLKVKETYEKAE